MSNYSNFTPRLRTVRRFLGLVLSGFVAMFLILWMSPRAIATAPSTFLDRSTVASDVVGAEQYTASVFSNWIELYLKKAKAPVILDGQELFFVTEIDGYSAEFRAEWISSQLEQVANSSDPFEVKVEQSNNDLTIISLNDQQLLTVTASDAAPKSPEKQAKEWTEVIENSLAKAQEQRQLDSFFVGLGYTALIIIGAAVISSLLKKYLRQLWQRFEQPSTQDDTEKPQQLQSLSLLRNISIAIVHFVVWFLALFGIINLFPQTRTLGYQIADALFKTLTSPIFNLGQKSYSVPDLLLLLGLLVLLIVGSGKATYLFKSRILQITGINRGAQEAIAAIIRYSTISIGTVVILQVWGLDLSSLTILVSALGVGIGLGFQDIAKNFASGVILLFERPIQVGDFVEVGSYTGIVQHIGARSTTIRTLDGISIILPNSRFLENEVINWSHSNPLSRLHIPVGVAYGSDIDAVKSTLLDAGRSGTQVVLNPPPEVMFIGFGDNSLDFELLVWIDQPNQLFFIQSELNSKIEKLLRQKNIEIPFPQKDLHVRSGTLPLQLSSDLENTLVQLLQTLLSKNGHFR